MTDQHGGYRRPTNPAPVSGPGALSQRTDGAQPIMSLPDADYGEQKTYREQQQGAPVAQSSMSSAAPSGLGGMAGPGIIPFGAPTQHPDEEVTTGAAMGPGAGTEVMNFPSERAEDIKSMQGSLAFLQFMADQPGSSWAARNAVRRLIAEQSA